MTKQWRQKDFVEQIGLDSSLQMREKEQRQLTVRGGKSREAGISVLSLRNGKMTCTGILAALLLHLPGNSFAKDRPKH